MEIVTKQMLDEFKHDLIKEIAQMNNPTNQPIENTRFFRAQN